jgi:GTP-dependent phosphoenolpyruvate carboxykinase
MEALFNLPKEMWQQEVHDIRKYFEEQVSEDLPAEIMEELQNLEKTFITTFPEKKKFTLKFLNNEN